MQCRQVYFRTTYGNRNISHKIKLMQYNKGNSNFGNHVHNLQNIIQKNSPDILCISEANVKSKYFSGSPNDFPGYNLELNAQYNLIGTSRNCILIRDTIKYNRRTDLEDTLNCDIWFF